MKKFVIKCPCCNQNIYCCLNGNNDIVVRHFDIYDNAEVFKVIKGENIELGIVDENNRRKEEETV